MKTHFRGWIGVLVLLSACRSTEAVAADTDRGLHDHHVHLLGPQLLADWKSLGVTFSRPDEVYLQPDSLFEPRGDEPPLASALLVPMAHFYGNEEFRSGLGLTLEQEHARVRAENDHVAAQAARFPGRACLLASVDLLRPYAQEELERCNATYPIAGVKIHLASAGFHFEDPEHVSALARTARWASERGLFMLLHLDPQRRGLVTGDVTRLLDEVLGPLPSMRVVIAHAGGSGGFGPWPRSVLETIAAWLASEQAAGRPRRGFFVDLSTVPMIRESEGLPPSTEEEIAALAPVVRRLGLEHVLFASDYPVFDPRDQAVFLRERCGFTEEELATIFAATILSSPAGASAQRSDC